jgi:uncharacterized protein YegP (UPF0339 family)
MAVQFNVFLDRRREWRWQLQDTDTEVPLADSAVAYGTEEACRHAIQIIRLFAPVARTNSGTT